MPAKSVLVINANERFLRSVKRYFEARGMGVVTLSRCNVNLAAGARPAVVILDVCARRCAGCDLVSRVRASPLHDVPVLVLSARASLDDKIRCFEAGADDYVAKPVKLRELMLRVQALVRRSAYRKPVFSDATVHIDVASRTLLCGGEPRSLSSAEWSVLSILLEEDRPFARKEIGARLWGRREGTYERTIDRLVVNIRSQVEPVRQAPQYVLTVRGVGYQFSRDTLGKRE
jgi:DNA-binding response OmpR family regulator